MLGVAPWRGKSIAVQTLIIAFALSGRKSRLQQHPGRCPGLMALSPFRGIVQAVGLIPFKHLYIHRVRGVYRTAIVPNKTNELSRSCQENKILCRERKRIVILKYRRNFLSLKRPRTKVRKLKSGSPIKKWRGFEPPPFLAQEAKGCSCLAYLTVPGMCQP